jgi:hypothetical protein
MPLASSFGKLLCGFKSRWFVVVSAIRFPVTVLVLPLDFDDSHPTASREVSIRETKEG